MPHFITRTERTYHLCLVQLHHGEKNIGLEQVAPPAGILVHTTLEWGHMDSKMSL